MIELESVSRSYGRKKAVDGLTLSIPPGRLFAFLGPNGAGKTTTIRMLVGLLRPDSGTIHVCGLDMTKETRDAAGLIGYVADDSFLYDKLSGRELLEFVGEIRGMTRQEVARRIEREIGRFELGAFIDLLIETYSHGMKQRVALASALMHDPKVLVVDEPLLGLDPRSVRFVKDLLREHTRRGATVFLSTHTLSVVEEIADSLGIIHQGRLLFVGSIRDLRARLTAEDQALESMFLQLTEENGA